MSDSKTNQPNYMIPGAIIIAGLIIGGAIFSDKSPQNNNNQHDEQMEETDEASALDSVNDVTEDDFIMGSREAKVTIIEYSDFDCPFCQRFHDTMNQVKDSYSDDDVAWVFRHFPLDSLHPNARLIANASECAAAQGGNDAFWAFADGYFGLRAAGQISDANSAVSTLALQIGINQVDFDACVANSEFDDNVQADAVNAVATGGQGTPWSVVVLDSGEKLPISGAWPYDQVKEVVDQALSQ